MTDNPKLLSMSFFRQLYNTTPEQHSVDWLYFKETLSHKVCEDKKDAKLLSPVIYKSGATRGNKGAEFITAAVLDFDNTSGDPISMEQSLNLIDEYDAVGYTTWSHMADGKTPKFRWIIRMSRPLTPDEWLLAREALQEEFFDENIDTSCFDATRAHYVPSAPSSRIKLAEKMVTHGKPLDSDELVETGRELYQEKREQFKSQNAEAIKSFERVQINPDLDYDIKKALNRLDPSMTYPKWMKVIAALATIADRSYAIELAEAWALCGDRKERYEIRKRIDSFDLDHPDRYNLETLFWMVAHDSEARTEDQGIFDLAGHPALEIPEFVIDNGSSSIPEQPIIDTDTGEIIEADQFMPNLGDLWRLDDAGLIPSADSLSLYGDRTIIKGGIVLVAGQPKIGKSFLVGDIMINACLGRGLFGGILQPAIEQPLKVLWLQAELRVEFAYDRLKAQIKRMIQTGDLDPKHIDLIKDNAFLTGKIDLILTETKDFDQMAVKVQAIQPDLIIVDPVINFSKTNENDAIEVGELLRSVNRLRLMSHTDCTAILVHHIRKGDVKNVTDPFDMIRGASAFRGWADTNIMVINNHETGNVEFHFEIRNGRSIDPIEGKLVQGVWQFERRIVTGEAPNPAEGDIHYAKGLDPKSVADSYKEKGYFDTIRALTQQGKPIAQSQLQTIMETTYGLSRSTFFRVLDAFEGEYPNRLVQSKEGRSVMLKWQ